MLCLSGQWETHCYLNFSETFKTEIHSVSKHITINTVNSQSLRDLGYLSVWILVKITEMKSISIKICYSVERLSKCLPNVWELSIIFDVNICVSTKFRKDRVPNFSGCHVAVEFGNGVWNQCESCTKYYQSCNVFTEPTAHENNGDVCVVIR